MTNAIYDTALIISLKAGILNASALWGTGGWMPPAEREELDWLTLIKWMGWRSKLIHPDEFNAESMNSCHIKWIILAGDPDIYDGAFIQKLFDILETHPVLIISKAGKKDSDFSKQAGTAITEDTTVINQFDWITPEQRHYWHCRKDIDINLLDCTKESESMVTSNKKIVVAVNKRSVGKWVFTSFNPGEYRDKDGCFTSLLKRILVYQSCLPVAWFNFENTVVLRMDDPGSSEPVYHSVYQNTRLGEGNWALIGEELKKRNARLTLGYVSGWVDDGDITRGNLMVNGERVTRASGKAYPSSLVNYERLTNESKKVFDYESEFRGIEQLRRSGLAETELHGYTHIYPDKKTWLAAANKYNNRDWYREFGKNTLEYVKNIPVEKHPFNMGLQTFQEIFNTDPTTLICPGDEFTNDVLQKALTAGLLFVSSYYLATRINDKLYWDQHVCAPYLDKADAAWFDAGLPVVGYFHDFDISLHGIGWFIKCLDGWTNAGARHFIDFRELAGILSHTIAIEQKENGYELKIIKTEKWDAVKPCRLSVFFPESNSTIHYACNLNQSVHSLNSDDIKLLNEEPVIN